ncbi:DUF1616 domain-containing protein [Halarchaeum sp. P4]|uniref:DUF1616 domain-containing protein n=1 Tax=Halarchaeum sp. P4 TaxID=3421639 RepID=UPI003EB6A0EE
MSRARAPTVAAVSLTLASAGVLAPDGALRLALALPLLCVLPGYALTTLLYPASRRDADAAALTPARRVALSLAFSLVLVPLCVLGVSTLGLALDRVPILAAVVSLTLGLLAAGASRRPDPSADTGRLANARDRLGAGSRADTAFRVAVVAAAGLAVSALLVGVVAPHDGTQFTEAALLTADASGDLSAGDYPIEGDAGGTDPLVLRLQNHEGETLDYGVVERCQRVGANGTVHASRVLARHDAHLRAGGTATIENLSTCALAGERVRHVVSVYRDRASGDAALADDYRTLTLWVRTPNATANTSATAPR